MSSDVLARSAAATPIGWPRTGALMKESSPRVSAPRMSACVRTLRSLLLGYAVAGPSTIACATHTARVSQSAATQASPVAQLNAPGRSWARSACGRPFRARGVSTFVQASTRMTAAGSSYAAAYVGVAEAVGKYSAALHSRNVEDMKQVWHPSCHLKRLDDDDEVVDIPAERFLAIVAEGTPTADAEAVAQDGIHNIDVLHPESAALATVQIVLPPKRYTDLLSLLKLDGQWKIINKVFTSVDDSELSYREPAASCVESHAPIAAALSTYFDACHRSDPQLMRRVLHPSACLYASEGGALVQRDCETFLRDMAARAVSTSAAETAYDKILSISKTGAKSAVAKVQIGFPAVGKLFTDHLSMLRVKGCWMIVSKTYAFQPWTLA